MKRIVGWLVFVVALVVLAVLIYAFAPPTPRWARGVEVPSPKQTGVRLRLLDGGKQFLAYQQEFILGNSYTGQVERRDAETGQLLSSHWGAGAERSRFTVSPSGRWAVAVRQARPTALQGIDLHTGSALDRPLRNPAGRCTFGVTSGDLAVLSEPPEGVGEKWSEVVLDLRTGDVVLKGVERSALFSRPACVACGERVVFLGNDRRVTFWDVRTRAVVGALPEVADEFEVTPDGKGVVTRRGSRRTGTYWRADDPARPRRLSAQPAPPVGRVDGEYPPWFSPDGRWLVVPDKSPVWDLTTGEVAWDAGIGNELQSTPDGRTMLSLGSDRGGKVTARVLFPAEKRVGAELTVPADSPVLAPDGRLIAQPVGGRLTALDPDTAAVRWTHPSRFDDHFEQRFAADGRQLWFTAANTRPPDEEGWIPAPLLRWVLGSGPPVSGAVIGVACPSGRELFRLTGPGLSEVEPAADGCFVLTCGADGSGAGTRLLLRRWDIPPPKPWGWIVGVPLTLGAALLALRAWWKASGTRQGAEEAPP
jgi:hypothetical protein